MKKGRFSGLKPIHLLNHSLWLYTCHTFSESCVTKEDRGIEKMMLGDDLKPLGIFSSLRTQTGPWSDTASYCNRSEDKRMVDLLTPDLCPDGRINHKSLWMRSTDRWKYAFGCRYMINICTTCLRRSNVGPWKEYLLLCLNHFLHRLWTFSYWSPRFHKLF